MNYYVSFTKFVYNHNESGKNAFISVLPLFLWNTLMGIISRVNDFRFFANLSFGRVVGTFVCYKRKILIVSLIIYTLYTNAIVSTANHCSASVRYTTNRFNPHSLMILVRLKNNNNEKKNVNRYFARRAETLRVQYSTEPLLARRRPSDAHRRGALR